MKKVLFVVAFAAIGLASAYASVTRATFSYVQTSPGSWILLSVPFDPAKCVDPTTELCSYTTQANIGSPVTKAQLTAAGAQPQTSFTRIYHP